MFQRWYFPETGTFVSKAPLGPMIEHPFDFANRSPAMHSDPTGRFFGISCSKSVSGWCCCRSVGVPLFGYSQKCWGNGCAGGPGGGGGGGGAGGGGGGKGAKTPGGTGIPTPSSAAATAVGPVLPIPASEAASGAEAGARCIELWIALDHYYDNADDVDDENDDDFDEISDLRPVGLR